MSISRHKGDFVIIGRPMTKAEIKDGARASGWLESEIAAWQAERIAERDDNNKK